MTSYKVLVERAAKYAGVYIKNGGDGSGSWDPERTSVDDIIVCGINQVLRNTSVKEDIEILKDVGEELFELGFCAGNAPLSEIIKDFITVSAIPDVEEKLVVMGIDIHAFESGLINEDLYMFFDVGDSYHRRFKLETFLCVGNNNESNYKEAMHND